MIKIYDEENYSLYERDGEDKFIKDYFKVFLLNENYKEYIPNIDTNIKIIKNGNLELPFTINNEEYESAYVTSLHTHYISYAIEELKALDKKWLEILLMPIIKVLSGLLKFTKINKVILLNNFLLSTNLYGEVPKKELLEIIEYLKEEYKDYAIGFKGFNEMLDNNLINTLEEAKSIILPCRQVYILDSIKNIGKRKREDIRRDLKKMKNNNLTFEKIQNISYAKDIEKLYFELYVNKYSKYNPIFTQKYIEYTLENNLIEYYGLFEENILKGIAGFYVRNNSMTTPIFGYDMNDKRKDSLYLMMTSALIMEAEKRNLILHNSSGAAKCKRNRGAKGYIESYGFFIKHLPLRRRMGFNIINFLVNKIAKPIIIKYEL